MNHSKHRITNVLPPPSLLKHTYTQSTSRMIVAESTMRGYRPSNEDESIVKCRFTSVKVPVSKSSTSESITIQEPFSSSKSNINLVKSSEVPSRKNFYTHEARYSILDQKISREYSKLNGRSNSSSNLQLNHQSHSSLSNVQNEDCPVSLFCVFDGHGGNSVSKMLKREFASRLQAEIDKASRRAESSPMNFSVRDHTSARYHNSLSLDEYFGGIKLQDSMKPSLTSYLKYRPYSRSHSDKFKESSQERMNSRPINLSHSTHSRSSSSSSLLASNKSSQQLGSVLASDKLLQQFHLDLDRYILENTRDNSGSCSVSALLTFLPDQSVEVIAMNVGDSRCVVCDNSKVYCLTNDHKPTHPIERQRIENANHTVMNMRVDGQLAISRAFGNRMYKDNKSLPQHKQAVTALCDIQRLRLPKARKFSQNLPLSRSASSFSMALSNFRFVVLACDGIWDVMTELDVCSFISRRLFEYDIGNELKRGHTSKMSVTQSGSSNRNGRITSTQQQSAKYTSWYNTPVSHWKSKDIIEWISTLSLSLQSEMKSSLHEIASLNGSQLMHEIQKEVQYLSALQEKYKLKDPVLDALKELKYRLEKTDEMIKRRLMSNAVEENNSREVSHGKTVPSSIMHLSCEEKLARIAEELLDECVVTRMSTDNVSVCIILLKVTPPS